MKDYPYVPGWRQNKENNKPAIKHSVLMFTTHGIVEGEWVGNEWVQYRWSCKVKDIEVLYWMHLEDLTQFEKEGDCFQQEQPEVDLEKEIDKEWENCCPIDEGMGDESARLVIEQFHQIARHFYGLRNCALEESAQHVYESWMGGTMGDVRRDMVELGKVLNARKKL